MDAGFLVAYLLPMPTPIEIREYLTSSGRSPFSEWFGRLEAMAAVRVTAALTRMATGNRGDSKSVGGGVWERRIDYGAGYRLYFAQDGEALIVLLVGGTKKRQQSDIDRAKSYWDDYKKRKAVGE